MTEQTAVAGRLVETAARGIHAHDWPDERWEDVTPLLVEEYPSEAKGALAAVLPLLADEIDADAQIDADVAGNVARAGGDSRYASGRASGMHHAAYLLRGFAADLAVRVAR